jgi:Flp pilus assembly protein TadB
VPAGMIPVKGVENMRLLGLIFLIAAVVFILLGVFLKLAAFFFVSMLTLIAALVLFMILKKNQHNQT